MYKCKECNKAVIVIDSKIIRECNHKDAPVIAERKAILTGNSRMS